MKKACKRLNADMAEQSLEIANEISQHAQKMQKIYRRTRTSHFRTWH